MPTPGSKAFRARCWPRCTGPASPRRWSAAALGLWLGRRILRRVRTTLDRRYRSRIRHIRLGAIEIVREEQLWQVLHRAVGVAAALLALVAGYAYLDYVLLLFPWTRELGNSLSAILLRPLATLGAGALRYLPDLVFLVILALLTRYLLKVIRFFLRRVGDGTLTLPGFEPDWAQPTDRIIRLLVIAFALVIAYPYIPGSESEAFKGITILLGVLFSLGSSSVIGNMVAGQIVIPNSLILNSEVVNFSTLARDAGVILYTTVGIGYETPWRQVEAMLLEAAARTPGLLQQPGPFVLQKALGSFAVDYEINAYCDDPRAMILLYSALHRSILDVFNEYGVQIMTPAYEGDPERPKVVPRQEWFAAPAQPAGLTRTGEDGASGTRG